MLPYVIQLTAPTRLYSKFYRVIRTALEAPGEHQENSLIPARLRTNAQFP